MQSSSPHRGQRIASTLRARHLPAPSALPWSAPGNAGLQKLLDNSSTRSNRCNLRWPSLQAAWRCSATWPGALDPLWKASNLSEGSSDWGPGFWAWASNLGTLGGREWWSELSVAWRWHWWCMCMDRRQACRSGQEFRIWWACWCSGESSLLDLGARAEVASACICEGCGENPCRGYLARKSQTDSRELKLNLKDEV